MPVLQAKVVAIILPLEMRILGEVLLFTFIKTLIQSNFRFSRYYETVAGGSGAGPTWHGQSGVHVHMTNTR